MRDFKNISLGDPDFLNIDVLNRGYADSFSVKLNATKLEKKGKRPKRLIKTATTEVAVDVECNLSELTAINTLASLGIQDNVLSKFEGNVISTFWKTLVTRENSTAYLQGVFLEPITLNGKIYEVTTAGTSGSSVPTYPTTAGETVTDGDAVLTCRAYSPETLTMSPYQSGTLDFINLSGENIMKTTGNKPLVYNSTLTTKYTEGTDYFVNYEFGLIFRIPSGSIAKTQALRVLYKYIEIDKQRIKFKPEDFKLLSNPVQFAHTMPAGKKIEFTFFNMQSGDTGISMGDSWSDLKLKLSANSAENRPNYSFGRISILDN